MIIYDEVRIYYFSGTGNAKNVAFWIADEARRNGIVAFQYDIAGAEPPNVSFDSAKKYLIGFCGPTHGFDFPEIMNVFIRRFPRAACCDFSVINTRAGTRIGGVLLPGLSGILHYKAVAILNRKGLRFSGAFPVDLPSNWMSLHPALRRKSVQMMYEKEEPRVRSFVDSLFRGKKVYRAFFDFFQDLLVSPISFFYHIGGRFALAKTFFASRDCNMCGLCQRNCPVKAIERCQDRMFWSHKCESCMKCMAGCPRSAIQTAHGFFLLIYGLSVVGAYIALETLWQMLFSDKNDFIMIVALLLGVPFLFVGYRIIYSLMRFRLVERAMAWSSLTSFRFWGRYRAPESRDAKTLSNN